MKARMTKALERIRSSIERGQILLGSDMRSERSLTSLIREVRRWDALNKDALQAYEPKLATAYNQISTEIPELRGEVVQDRAELQRALQDRIECLVSIEERVSFAIKEQSVSQAVELEREQLSPTVFIVHGHDEALLFQTKDFLQNGLGLPEPVVLFQQPSVGRTLIEKFEECASKASVAVVLLTPDDFGGKAQKEAKARARQNVIFELGFFVGKFGRRSGRILVLHKGELEIPNDFSGVGYIDVSNGIKNASEEIRREFQAISKRSNPTVREDIAT